MTSISRYFFISLLLCFVWIQAGFSQQVVERPNPPRAVNDFAGIIAAGQESALERKLSTYEDTTSTAIVVVTVKSLNGSDAFGYAHKVASTWGVGRDDIDNGVVILVAPNERKAFIATGKGVEGSVTDLDAGRIVDFVMIPRFKEGNYYAGINDATSKMMELMAGEFTTDQLVEDPVSDIFPILLFIALVVLFLFVLPALTERSRYGERQLRRKGRGYTYDDRGVDPFGGTIIIGGHNDWGSFSSGSGDFGGFGGFGGGDFGGGGAGGSW